MYMRGFFYGFVFFIAANDAAGYNSVQERHG
jgi:hypothetical protein